MGTPRDNPLRRVIHEIHRRSLWQVLAIYVAASWMVFEVVQTLTEGLGLPGWFPAFAFVLLLIGLPVVLATAFVQEGGPTSDGSRAALIDATGQAIDQEGTSSQPADPARRLLTWRNAIAGGVLAFALWGVIATGWILFGRDGSVGAASEPGPARASLAVLPFDNLSPDPDNAYFAAGIHEELLTQLSRLEGIRLVSRTSVLKYQDTEQSLTEIGEALGVANVLEGSVQRVEDEVRITVQLNDAREDEHVWAESYERELSHIFEIQADVATRVVRAIRGVLTPREQADLAERPTDNLDAYAHYLRGHEHFRALFAEEETQAAADAYQRAVELDPHFAPAWSRLVQARTWLAWVWGHPEERRRARMALNRLEELAPGSAELRFARGVWLYYGVQRYEEALREFDALADLWPGDVNVGLYRGALHRRLGRWHEAVRVWEGVLELDPANAAVAFSIGQTHRLMRRFDAAERYASLAVSLDPIPVHWWSLVYTHLSRGDVGAAQSAVDSARQHLTPDRLESGGWWALWQAYSADPSEAFELYRERYRQPTFLDGTWWYAWDLGLAVAEASEGPEATRALADTLRTGIERTLAAVPTDNPKVRSRALSQLALAHGYLGDEERAVRLAREAVDLFPVSRDAYAGAYRVLVEAHVYAVVGRHEEAVNRLRYLLSIPAGGVTEALLRIDPRWHTLRSHPGFQALLEEQR